MAADSLGGRFSWRLKPPHSKAAEIQKQDCRSGCFFTVPRLQPEEKARGKASMDFADDEPAFGRQIRDSFGVIVHGVEFGITGP